MASAPEEPEPTPDDGSSRRRQSVELAFGAARVVRVLAVFVAAGGIVAACITTRPDEGSAFAISTDRFGQLVVLTVGYLFWAGVLLAASHLVQLYAVRVELDLGRAPGGN